VTDVVVDASALLAVLRDEPGADRVRSVIANCLVSAVNLAEVLTKLVQRGTPIAAAKTAVGLFNIRVVDFSTSLAERTGALAAVTRGRGLSLGDRACLALASERRLPALTADRSWHGLDLGVEVVLIR
jgi:PIN domain nuclease of toxin-antitoxin system